MLIDVYLGNIPSRVGLNRVTPFGLAERRSFPFYRRVTRRSHVRDSGWPSFLKLARIPRQGYRNPVAALRSCLERQATDKESVALARLATPDRLVKGYKGLQGAAPGNLMRMHHGLAPPPFW